jgi:L,D-peptidoglycan transpeptidase YkuD (ErfK/YbiS/YcfS/YnhG family)
LLACSPARSEKREVIPASAPQLVTAIVDDWDATHATLQLWKRDGRAWKKDGEAWPGVIGKAGAAWGDGLHGSGAPDGQKGPAKHEGDGKSPAGVFALRGAYGYAESAKTRLPYTALTPSWQCVDDPRSKHYATILDRSTVKPDWTSAETMRRDDALYTWVVDLAHNASRAPGAGSCIFLHVWSGPDSTTVGCTAMAEPRLAALIAQLDPRAVFVLLPRAAYDGLAASWKLPR